MATWVEKWIAICPDGIVTDQVINEVLALQIEQAMATKPPAVASEPIPIVDPGSTGEPGTGGTGAGEEGNAGIEVPPGP